ncbi:MAG TPA: response regulator transcription factor [Micromonosporaceae bacterium]|nr:response regulator transcription factor [Micromonosporaceae bacterium]
MRTVLVCVRTPLAAQTIAACAARLGVAAAVRTAVSEVEILARLAERPADVVLVDTALTRPDSAAFTRRVLSRAPRATLVLLGAEEPRAAAAAIAAGARGVIRGTGQDLVSSVTKALLLLCPPEPVPVRRDGDAAAVPVPQGQAEPTHDGAAADARTLPAATPPRTGAANGTTATVPSTMVPQQRGDMPNRGPGRRPVLTERELQVLRAMADGKSNAEIGRELYVSEDTVKTHARRLFRKLGARDRAHAVASGFRTGLVS